jgi:hypothetical protein
MYIPRRLAASIDECLQLLKYLNYQHGGHAMRHVRTFLSIEALAFGAAALIHTGAVAHGYEHRKAAIAESVIAGVLLLGLAVVTVRGQSSRAVGLAAQGFALFGTFVGLFTIAIGIGPQSRFDLALHAGFVTLLVAGLASVARRRANGRAAIA